MAADDVTLGELSRRILDLTVELRQVNTRLENLSSAYIPRGEHELAVGGIKVDLMRVETTANEATRNIAELDNKIDARFRTAVITVVSALIFPGVIALVVWLLTQVTS